MTEPSDPRELGRTQRVYEQVTKARFSAGQHLLPQLTGIPIPLRVQNFDIENGRVAIDGQAEGEPNSSFILKGERDDLSGWLALRDRGIAYRYRTHNGAFLVEQVPLEQIYPVCNHHRPPPAERNKPEPEPELAAAPSSGEPWIGPYNNSDLRKLQSRPGAPKVIYLNITAAMNGDTPRDFSKEEMWKSWAGTAAAYSAWNVNVTTDPEVYAAAGVTNSGVADFKAVEGRANCPLGAFGTRQACLVYTESSSEPEKGYGVARTAAHELGHLLGLDHDGDSGDEYASTIKGYDWCPLMGNYYTHRGNEALNQWSKGEYNTATQKQDDLAIITKSLPYREDDIPNTKALVINGTTVTSDVNRGQIGKNTDTDTFTFKITASGGHATLNIDRIEDLGGAMLDVDARLMSGTGGEVAASNPKAARGAKIDVDLPVGDYTLVIKGGAEGTPAQGFSNYSSLGYYGIKGTINGGMTGGGAGGGGGTGGGAGATGTGGGGGNSSGGATGKGGGSQGGFAGSTSGGAGGGSAGKGGAAGATSGGKSGGGAAGASSGGFSPGGSAGGGGIPTTSGGAPTGSGGTPTFGGSPTTSGGASSGGATSGGATSGGATSGGAPTTSGGSSSAGAGPVPPPPDPGCSCSSVGSESSNSPLGLLVAAAASVIALRRRRGRAEPR